ncbi:hypothetical protein [Mycobacterium asiaticum]|uniref:hypothetical protein n=1 Tax=Mycobacterium asiaticum TaxID=1790 RepID=UPI000B2175F4|nr:hypothetical protein [Mycobacterium asiaticum]
MTVLPDSIDGGAEVTVPIIRPRTCHVLHVHHRSTCGSGRPAGTPRLMQRGLERC